MASEEDHEDEDVQVIMGDPEEDQYQLRDLERILSIPLDVLTALEVSEEFSIVPNLIIRYVQDKQEEIRNIDVVVQEYVEAVEQSRERIEELEGELSAFVLAKAEVDEQYSELKSEYDQYKESNDDSTQLLIASREEVESLKSSLEEYQGTIRELQEEIESLQNQSHDLHVTNTNLQEELENANSTIEELRPPPDIPGADRDELLRLLDRRQRELSQLTTSWSNVSEKLEMTTSEKQAIQLKLDELVSQESSTQLKEQLLSREKLLVQQQNDWLTKELELKNTQVFELKKERASILTEKEMLVTSKEQELTHLRSTLASKTELVQELQGRLDSTHSRLMEIREEQATIEDQLRRELASQSKLAALYQSASSDGEMLVTELMGKLESLQSSLDQLAAAKEAALKRAGELEERLSLQETESSSHIKELETELRNANELLSTARRQGTLPLTEGEVLSLSPAATATSSLLTSGMTLTQIYTRYVQSTDELGKLKEENIQLNNYLKQIMEELDEKTPALQRLRRDHDVLQQKCQAQQDQITGLLEEFETVRLESEESIKFSRSLERENKRLKTLSGDLGRQVKVLLKEVEEARGGVASTSSHDWSHDLSSDDVTSSSQVISDHLVLFRNVDELQDQNQKLLTVVRELGETREKEENIIESQSTCELKQRLEEAVRELNLLKESRERQKEMVESIVKQRDMYRILLAQSTPLPEEAADTSQLSTSQGAAGILVSPQKTTPTTSIALQELKEQFEAYRKEKATNDSILQEQISQYRDEAAKARLDSATLASKLEYSTERYQMLESSYKELKGELTALRNKDKLLNNSLTKSQGTVDSLTKELLSSRESLSRLEVRLRSLQSERDLLSESEKRTRRQYDDLMKEQSSQSLLLTNLQTLQNNLERNEYETKSRLSYQIETLEKEAGLLKERLHNEEEKRERIKSAYDTQVHDLSQKLLTVQTHENELLQNISSLEERASGAESELAATNETLEEVKGQLEETKDRLRAMEDDAGAEFRSNIRILERKVADGNAKITSLEEQLKFSQSHAEQYKSISEANEKSLEELNATSEIFKNTMNQELERLKGREEELVKELETMREERERIEAALREELKQTKEELQSTLQTVSEQHERVEEAEKAMRDAQNDQMTAREDAKRCMDSAREHEELYQRELVQHGHTMERLNQLKEREEEKERELAIAKEEAVKLKQEIDSFVSTHGELESRLIEEKQQAEERCQHLSSQNDLLHTESNTLSAKLITLTQQISEGAGTVSVVNTMAVLEQDGKGAESAPPTSSENLWEVIRYVRREKEIAETKKDLAEGQVSQLRQNINQLTHQLEQSRQQVQELTEATIAHESTSVEYEKILKDLQTLNALSDSNKLLRDENKSLQEKVASLQSSNQESLVKIQALRDSQQSLSSQKDALLVEKVALKKEVDRWNQRTNQLIEQYNKIDPEEYRQLVQEKDVREAELAQLTSNYESLTNEKAELEETLRELRLQSEGQAKRGEELEAELVKMQSETKTQKEEIAEKNKMILKIKELGRKYRSMSEEFKKKLEESENQRTELESQIEELKRSPPESIEQQSAMTDLQAQLDKMKGELEASKASHDTLSASLAEKEDKLSRIIKTARALKTKNEALKTDKDSVDKEFEETKAAHSQNVSALELANSALQSRLEALQSQYDTDTKRLEERIEKLEGDLRSKSVVTRRRVVQPTVVVPVESPSTTVTVQAAPTAAVKPTVTTTPTASIRPMPLQMTTAPTAHVTPTQVTTTIPVTSEATPTPSSSSGSSTVGSAAVFMRSTSPLMVTQTTPSQATPTSSMSEGAAPVSRPVERPVKRAREATESSAVDQHPPVKRSRQIVSEAEPSTTTDHSPSAPPTDTPTESDRSPDTQSDQDVIQPDDETTPLSSAVTAPLAGISSAEVAMTTEDVPRRAESEGPTSSVLADTTSGVDQTSNAEQQQQATSGHEEQREEEEEEESAVVMETEPSALEGNEDVAEGEPGVVMDTMEGRGDDDVIEIEDDEGTLEPTPESGVGEEITAEMTEEREEEEEEEIEEGEIEEREEEEEEEEEEGEVDGQYDIQQDEGEAGFHLIVHTEDEQSIGLPENEDVIEITASSSSVPPLAQSHHLQVSSVPAVQSLSVPSDRRLGLRERAGTPGGSVELNGILSVGGGDHQVPCTPVLAEDKQLGKAPALQSVPADLSAPTSSSGVAVQQLGDREDRGSGGEREEATSSQGDVISTFEVTQFGELSSTTTSATLAPPTAPPPPASVTHSDLPSHDPSPEEEEEEEGQPLSGDIGDDVIMGIIASSDDEEAEEGGEIEEGELAELQTIDSTHQESAAAVLPSRASSAPVAIAAPVPSSLSTATASGTTTATSTTAAVSSVIISGQESKRDTERKIEPIVWDESQPSTSGQASGRVTKLGPPKSSLSSRRALAKGRGAARTRGGRKF